MKLFKKKFDKQRIIKETKEKYEKDTKIDLDQVALVDQELTKNGIKKSLIDMGKQISVPIKAFPILLYSLRNVIADIHVKEKIVRLMTIKIAKDFGAGQVLIDEFHDTNNDYVNYKWAIGNTIEVIIDETIVDDVLKIIKNKENGSSRQMFVMALGKTKKMELDETLHKEIEDTLIELLDDEEVVGHALDALGKLKSKKGIPKIELCLENKRAYVRKEAKKALAKIKL